MVLMTSTHNKSVFSKTRTWDPKGSNKHLQHYQINHGDDIIFMTELNFLS